MTARLKKTDASRGAVAPGGPEVPEGRTAIVAGSGQLPVAVARALAERRANPLIIMVEGEADPELAAFDHVRSSLGGLGRQISVMRAAGIRNVVLAGGIGSRPSLRQIRFDRFMLKNLPRALAALGKGDDAVLRAMISIIEDNGMRVVGADTVVPSLVAARALRGRLRPAKGEARNIALAWRAAKALGALDIGQGTVSVGGRVVAVEGAEGTDAMLARVGELKASGRIPTAPGGVLVKCAKPRQDLRADLPSIGPSTVGHAANAGLRGIVVEAGRALVMEHDRMLSLADASGIFIAAMDEGEALGG